MKTTRAIVKQAKAAESTAQGVEALKAQLGRIEAQVANPEVSIKFESEALENYLESVQNAIEAAFVKFDERISRIEAKLDQFLGNKPEEEGTQAPVETVTVDESPEQKSRLAQAQGRVVAKGKR